MLYFVISHGNNQTFVKHSVNRDLKQTTTATTTAKRTPPNIRLNELRTIAVHVHYKSLYIS